MKSKENDIPLYSAGEHNNDKLQVFTLSEPNIAIHDILLFNDKYNRLEHWLCRQEYLYR